jgi:hypothetical protein
MACCIAAKPEPCISRLSAPGEFSRHLPELCDGEADSLRATGHAPVKKKINIPDCTAGMLAMPRAQ